MNHISYKNCHFLQCNHCLFLLLTCSFLSVEKDKWAGNIPKETTLYLKNSSTDWQQDHNTQKRVRKINLGCVKSWKISSVFIHSFWEIFNPILSSERPDLFFLKTFCSVCLLIAVSNPSINLPIQLSYGKLVTCVSNHLNSSI